MFGNGKVDCCGDGVIFFHILSLFFRTRITTGPADLFSKLPESELTDLVGTSLQIRSRLVCILSHMSWEIPETFHSGFSTFLLYLWEGVYAIIF